MKFLKFNTGIFASWGDSLLNALLRVAQFKPISWSSLTAIVLGIMVANWSWALISPNAPYISSSPERSASAESDRLFGIAATGGTTAQGAILSNVQLIGVFAASAYKPGFAILKVDNRQMGVAVGETIVSGSKLLAVKSDHVLIERDGIQQKVNLERQLADNSGITFAKKNTSQVAEKQSQAEAPKSTNVQTSMQPQVQPRHMPPRPGMPPRVGPSGPFIPQHGGPVTPPNMPRPPGMSSTGPDMPPQAIPSQSPMHKSF